MPPGAIQPRRPYDRRTGAALLSLVAATNVIPWMELLLGETESAELLAPSEIRTAVGTCLLALLLLLGAWFSGRRNPFPAKALISRPRLTGLRLAVAAAAGNLVLTAIVRWLGSRRLYELPANLPVFSAIWYLVILPVQVAAAFSLGRAGKLPGRRREPPGPSPESHPVS